MNIFKILLTIFYNIIIYNSLQLNAGEESAASQSQIAPSTQISALKNEDTPIAIQRYNNSDEVFDYKDLEIDYKEENADTDDDNDGIQLQTLKTDYQAKSRSIIDPEQALQESQIALEASKKILRYRQRTLINTTMIENLQTHSEVISQYLHDTKDNTSQTDLRLSLQTKLQELHESQYQLGYAFNFDELTQNIEKLKTADASANQTAIQKYEKELAQLQISHLLVTLSQETGRLPEGRESLIENLQSITENKLTTPAMITEINKQLSDYFNPTAQLEKPSDQKLKPLQAFATLQTIKINKQEELEKEQKQITEKIERLTSGYTEVKKTIKELQQKIQSANLTLENKILLSKSINNILETIKIETTQKIEIITTIDSMVSDMSKITEQKYQDIIIQNIQDITASTLESIRKIELLKDTKIMQDATIEVEKIQEKDMKEKDMSNAEISYLQAEIQYELATKISFTDALTEELNKDKQLQKSINFLHKNLLENTTADQQTISSENTSKAISSLRSSMDQIKATPKHIDSLLLARQLDSNLEPRYTNNNGNYTTPQSPVTIFLDFCESVFKYKYNKDVPITTIIDKKTGKITFARTDGQQS